MAVAKGQNNKTWVLLIVIFTIKLTAFNCYFKDGEPASMGRKTQDTGKAIVAWLNIMDEKDFIQKMNERRMNEMYGQIYIRDETFSV